MLSIVLTVAGPIAVAALVAAARRAGTTERARALGHGRRWRLPGRVRPIVARALADADLALDPEPAVELWAGGVGAAGLISAAMSPGLVLPALSFTTAAAPATLWVLRTRAQRRYAGALPLALEQIALAQDFFKAGSMHSQQPHLSSLPPVLAEQASHLLEDLGIDLSRIRQRVRASDS